MSYGFEMNDKIKNFKKIFIIVWVVFVLCFVIISVIAYVNGEWRFDYNVSMENVSIYDGSDLNNGLSKPSIEILTNEMENVYIYGYLYTGTDIDVRIQVYLYKEDEDRPVAKNSLGEKYYTGDFYYFLQQEIIQEPGFYRVDIYFGRNIIASKKFEVINTGL